ncbi:MAG: OmpA family protein [Spirochaetales bacterium]|nr:OmpA family protein [Spirochaetales bacterium]
MKRQLLSLLVLLLFIPIALPADELPIYPGKTISYGSSFYAGVAFPLDGGWSYGGSIQTAFYFKDVIPSTLFGITGGYNFLLESGESRFFSNGGIRGSYSFPLAGFFSLNPGAGFTIAFPHNFSDSPVIPVFEGGLEMRFQLFDRNCLSFEALMKYPVGETLPLQFFLGIGLTRYTPLKIKSKPVEAAFSAGPSRFSPDNDGDNDNLEIEMDVVNGQNVKRWDIQIFDEYDQRVKSWAGGSKPPAFTHWDGITESGELVDSAMYYRIEMKIEDILGNVFTDSEEIMTDILIQKIGGKFKIMIPNIVFPPNSADFTLLGDDDLAKNTEIIRKIAVKLEKYPEYRVRIEGHGNLDFWRDEAEAAIEQEEILIPLTEARANMIKEVLIQEGVDGNRLLTEGLGGSNPIVPFEDKENRWKNRRVEFILLK